MSMSVKFGLWTFHKVQKQQKIFDFVDFRCPTDHVYALVRTSPWATHVFHAGDLVLAGTRLVTPDLQGMCFNQ